MELLGSYDDSDLGDIGGGNISISDDIDHIDPDIKYEADISHMSESDIESRIKIMQVQLIISASTEMDEFLWIHLFASDFRSIVTLHPEWSIFQVKHALYLPHLYRQD